MATNAAKLGVRNGTRLLVLGAPADEAAAIVGQSPEPPADGAPADVVLLFAAGVEQVHAEVARAWSLVAEGGRLWVAYRKGAGPSALNRDTLQRALGDHGLVGVTLVSLDDTWSAMRVRLT